MKIVIVSPYQFRLQRGIERFVFSLSNTLASGGNEVIVYTWSKGNASWGAWHEKVRIRSLPSFKYYVAKWASVFYRFWLKKDKPNSIILNFLYQGEESLPGRLNYCYVLHSPASQIPSRYKFIQSKLDKFSKMQFVAVSNMVKREALPYLGNRKITVISNGVDTSAFKPKHNETNQNIIKLISIAAFEERKGLQYVIAALNEYRSIDDKKIEYHIYGAGNYRDTLERLVKNYDLLDTVFLHEPISNVQQVLPLYDIFLLLSKGEAFPLAPIEAMASGLPVVTSHYDPYPEFVISSFGYMVDRENPVEIVDAIKRILVRYEEMSQNSRQLSLKYDWNKIATKYVKFLSDEYSNKLE